MEATERRHAHSRGLDTWSTGRVVELLLDEDRRALVVAARQRRDVARAAAPVARALETGGRVLLAGAGTSGRLGVLEAAELPPTFGTHPAHVRAVSSVMRPWPGASAACARSTVSRRPGSPRSTRWPSLYLEAVCRRQPEGPYLLGGWSFGGLVALEMARRLLAGNRAVARLVLIDTWADTRDGLADHDAALRVLIDQELGGSSLEDAPRRARSSRPCGRTSQRSGATSPARTPGASRSCARPCRSVPAGTTPRWAGRSWPPAASRSTRSPDTTTGMMREPHVRALAHALRSCIDVGAGAGAPPGTTP